MNPNQANAENPPCAVIVTAIPDEFRAVSSFLTAITRVKHPNGTIYRQGIFDQGGQGWKIIVCEIGAGNSGAALESERAVAFFKPKVLAFVGIAGGLKDVHIGDVVAATKVYGYEAGKAKEQFQTRPDVFRSSYELEQEARAAAREGTWIARSRHKSERIPRALVGPIAAGEKVVASTNSEVWQFIQSSYGDALAVEMEGLGTLKAAHANQPVKAIVVRGISDLIDEKAEADASGSQEVAADRASAFLFEMLANMNPDAAPVAEHASSARQEDASNAPQGSSRQEQPVDETEMLNRAKALIPAGRKSYDTGLSLIVVGGPRQQIVRPSKLESPELAEAIKKEARYGSSSIFDEGQGTQSRIDGQSLIVSQPNAAILLNEQGEIRITMPGRSDMHDKMVALPAIIEEEVADRLTRELRFASWLLDQVDSHKCLSDVALLVVFSGANYLCWRTRAEHQASPNRGSLGNRAVMLGDTPVVVHLSPAHLKRTSLAPDTPHIVQDLVALMRRKMRP